MAIEIKITNSEIHQEGRLLNNLKVDTTNNVKVEIDNLKVTDSATVLEDLTDTQVEDIIIS